MRFLSSTAPDRRAAMSRAAMGCETAGTPPRGRHTYSDGNCPARTMLSSIHRRPCQRESVEGGLWVRGGGVRGPGFPDSHRGDIRQSPWPMSPPNGSVRRPAWPESSVARLRAGGFGQAAPGSSQTLTRWSADSFARCRRHGKSARTGRIEARNPPRRCSGRPGASTTSSASTIAGSEPPSGAGVTSRVAVTCLIT